MGKRTSDVLALAAVATGAGFAFGLTGLFAGSASVAPVVDVPVEARDLSGRIMIQDISLAPGAYVRVDRIRAAVHEAQLTAARLAGEQREIEAEMDRLGEAYSGPGSLAGRSLQ